jgi:hypothetical protein
MKKMWLYPPNPTLLSSQSNLLQQCANTQKNPHNTIVSQNSNRSADAHWGDRGRRITKKENKEIMNTEIRIAITLGGRDKRAGYGSSHCYPSYSGDGDQEDHSAKPARAKQSPDPISTNGWAQWYMLQGEA